MSDQQQWHRSPVMGSVVGLVRSVRARVVPARWQDKVTGWPDYMMSRLRASREAGRLAGEPDKFACGRVLFVDDRVPHPWLGRGYPRSAAIIQALLDLGYAVTFYSASLTLESADEVYKSLDRRVEVILGRGLRGFRAFLRKRAAQFDACIVSRPHNMANLREALNGVRRRHRFQLIYDAEALYCLRELERLRVRGTPATTEEAARQLRRELVLLEGADAILAVSEAEAALLRTHNAQSHGPVYVMPHRVEIEPSPPAYSAREGFLFVGSLTEPDSPNADAIEWFVAEVVPLIDARLNGKVNISIAGPGAVRKNGASPNITYHGCVAVLRPLYDAARVFFAPTRFAAGVPLKIYEAAAAGIPIVATSLLARQLGWTVGVDLLVGDTREEFAEACVRLHEDRETWLLLQKSARARVAAECSGARFCHTLENVISGRARNNPEASCGAGR